MLQRMLRKAFDYACQKIVNLNTNISGRGFIEINPQYFDDMIVQSNLAEHWINQLDAYIVRAKIKEQMHKEGIARCTYLVQEILPIISTAMALLKQSVDYNTQIQEKLSLQEHNNKRDRQLALAKQNELSVVSDDEKIYFQNINLMLSDTFERLGEKRNEINDWLSQSQTNSVIVSEA